ncbi:MAG: hypothetical protein M1827_002983 [Pycnora praestabilis]|nr:MAG: hypothetical protein M1827_002983 [Pycnora praestabilis]
MTVTVADHPKRDLEPAEINLTSIERKRYCFGAQGPSLIRAITLAGAIGFFLFGYDQGVLGGLNASENFLNQFNNPSSALLGTINAIYEIGCFCGAISVFCIGETLGRKKCMYVGAVLMFIGAALQSSSYGVPQMIVGRIICGWGNGFNTATTPLWVSELTPAKSRGRHVALEGNLIAFGIVVAYYYNIGLSYITGPAQWRAPIASQGVIIIAQILVVLVLPESPRWLTKHGKHEEAIDILGQLKGKNILTTDFAVLRQKKAIDDALALEQADGKWHIMEIFKNGPLKIRRRFLLAIGLQAMQQLSGINVLVYYAPHTLTTDVGLDYETSLQVGAGLADTYWVFSFIPMFFLDRMGRRWPLIWGAAACGICFLLAGVLQKDITPIRAKVSLIWFFAYEAIFAVGWLPIPWLYAPEIMPLRHRTQCAALATASDWIFNYMIVQITPVAISNIRWKTYMIFFVLNIAFAILVWLVYPETSGRTLEEIDALYLGDNDRLFVIDRKGKILPGFGSRMSRPDNVDPMLDDGQSSSLSNSSPDEEKATARHREVSL